jgi:hypothetical protein
MPTSTKLSVEETEISIGAKLFPIKYSMIYLSCSFLLFVFSPLSSSVDNIVELSAFVSLSYFLFFLGFFVCVVPKRNVVSNSQFALRNGGWFVRVLIAVGGLYHFVWGVNQIFDFGGGGVADVVERIFNPGESYKDKFAIFEDRVNEGRVNIITQVLVVLSILYGSFVPLLVLYWRDLRFGLKLFSVSALFVYIASFLYIGTQKGIGDVLLYMLAGWSILLCSGKLMLSKADKTKILTLGLLVFLVSFYYMAVNQASRAVEFGISQSLMFGDTSGSWLAHWFGEYLAYGIYTVLSYPSHGYLGLSHNLGQEFYFSYGAGFSQAYESYRYQYFGGQSFFDLTYPARTEVATGWPAGMYWATVFPWLASDLSFPGVFFFIFLIGFIFGEIWLSCITRLRFLSVVALGQLYIFVAFIPANNQVLMQRQGLWVISTLVVFWLIGLFARKKL